MEQQPESRAVTQIDAIILDENGHPMHLSVTLTFPRGKGIAAVAGLRHMAVDHISDLVRTALLDQRTREAVIDQEIETLIAQINAEAGRS